MVRQLSSARNTDDKCILSVRVITFELRDCPAVNTLNYINFTLLFTTPKAQIIINKDFDDLLKRMWTACLRRNTF